jgi:hypothetical protein
MFNAGRSEDKEPSVSTKSSYQTLKEDKYCRFHDVLLSLHDVHQLNDLMVDGGRRPVHKLQLENCWTDFDYG